MGSQHFRSIRIVAFPDLRHTGATIWKKNSALASEIGREKDEAARSLVPSWRGVRVAVRRCVKLRTGERSRGGEITRPLSSGVGAPFEEATKAAKGD